jgi:hypothetical protein
MSAVSVVPQDLVLYRGSVEQGGGTRLLAI